MGSGKGKLYPKSDEPLKLLFNTAGSTKVREVSSVIIWHSHSTPPIKGEPDCVYRCFDNGVLTSERYYDSGGHPYLDIDYTNHGNAKLHPYVPNQHDIIIDSDNRFIRSKGEPIT